MRRQVQTAGGSRQGKPFFVGRLRRKGQSTPQANPAARPRDGGERITCRLHLLLFLPGSERLAAGVLLLDRAGLIHEEGEAARVVVACGFGARLVALAAGAGRDRELIAGRLRAEYVFGDEAGVNQRVQVARRARMLKRVGDLGGLYALEHVFGVLLVRGDALLEEEFLSLLLDE